MHQLSCENLVVSGALHAVEGFEAMLCWDAQVSVGVKLDLPQVAVVGSQSSGKSSVLEGLVCHWLYLKNSMFRRGCWVFVSSRDRVDRLFVLRRWVVTFFPVDRTYALGVPSSCSWCVTSLCPYDSSTGISQCDGCVHLCRSSMFKTLEIMQQSGANSSIFQVRT
jgi:hypothetical protein